MTPHTWSERRAGAPLAHPAGVQKTGERREVQQTVVQGCKATPGNLRASLRDERPVLYTILSCRRAGAPVPRRRLVIASGALGCCGRRGDPTPYSFFASLMNAAKVPSIS